MLTLLKQCSQTQDFACTCPLLGACVKERHRKKYRMKGLTGQLVVDGGGGRVAKAVQGLLGWPCLCLCQLQLLLNLFNHATAPSVYAEMLKGLLEVWDVCLRLDLQHLQRQDSFEEVSNHEDAKQNAQQLLHR